MIKIIKKFFTSPGNIEDSKVELVVEVPEKTRQDLFDEAVKRVVKEKLHGLLEDQLMEMCYTEAQINDTKKALEFNGGKIFLEFEKYHTVKEKFPNAVLLKASPNCCKIYLDFNLEKFINNLLKDVV